MRGMRASPCTWGFCRSMARNGSASPNQARANASIWGPSKANSSSSRASGIGEPS